MQPAPDDLISLSEAARQIGVNKSTLSRQVASGAIRSHTGKVRLSEVLADRAANIDLSNPARGPRVARNDATQRSPAGQSDDGAEEFVEVDGVVMPFSQAQAMKETYLARLRKLEFEQKSGALVDGERARAEVFDIARVERDAWVNWPSRVAPLIAAEIGVDAVALGVALERHVREHLAERAEPRLRLAG
ncbi:hypothetical protein [Methylorubrum extorquens]|jgi:hypothetical protein